MHLSLPVLISVFFIFQASRTNAQDKLSMIRSLEDSAKHYESLNKNRQAYQFSKKIQTLRLSVAGIEPEKIAKTESDLGTYAFRMGNISLAEKHHRKALNLFQSMSSPDYECLYLSGNNMGSIMWYASKTDSALYYFNLAKQALSKMDTTPLNKYYRPAVLNNNLAAIYGLQGKTTEGIAAMKITIRNIRLYLSVKDSSLRKDVALHFQFEAMDNLAGIYKELGDYRKAYDLLSHSYQQKQQTLNTGNPDIFKSETLLGQLYYAQREYGKAEQFLLKGLQGLKSADGDFLFWQADAYASLALLNDATGEKTAAAEYFSLADKFYEQSLQGEYDDIYLEFLRNASLFYAENGAPSIALKKARKGYDFVVAAQGKQTLPVFYQLLNIAEVYFAGKDYQQALQYGRKGLQLVNSLIVSGAHALDSIKLELKKPKALLLIAKSDYQLLDKKNTATLTPILIELQEALSILERRRSVIQDPVDINLLLTEHTDLLEFIKQIVFDLYKL
ncbi:MAG: tetratricopeptide repeat protein, partial [Flavitalea sp.]